MKSTCRLLCVFTIASGIFSAHAVAHSPAAMTVSPDKATIVVGSSQTFRAVGRDGRIRHNVRWSVLPEHAAILAVQGDEVSVAAREPSTSVVLTAVADGDSADASIEIRASQDMSAGTVLWSVKPVPGCKTVNITQAVPTANGPDLYTQEQCADGQYVRALTADGREMWRRQFGGEGAAPTQAAPITSGASIGFLPGGVHSPSTALTKEEPQPSEHIHSHASSVCDVISAGMGKSEISALLQARHLSVAEKQRQGNAWVVEEEGFQCAISFDDQTGTVFKKKKTLVTN